MQNILALTIREWKAFWYSPVAYVVGAFFFLMQGWVFWLLVAVLTDPRVDPSWNMSQLFFGTFFYWFSVLILAPTLTMRTFSEEKRTGTLETLLTAPVKDWEVVLSKFLGAWGSYCALWAATLVYFLILRWYTKLDWGPVLTGYLGTGLIGAVFVSIGVLASSMTRNQVIAAVVTFVSTIFIFSIGLMDSFVADPESVKIIQYLSFINHVRDFSKGLLDTRPLVLYLTTTAGALFLTIRAIASPRWRT